MEKALKKVVDILIENGSISQKYEEVYAYTLRSIWILGWNIIISLVIGFLMNMPIYCAVFLLTLIPLRSYAGGYHDKSLFFCYFLSYVTLIFALLWIKNTFPHQELITAVGAVVSWVAIFRFAPLENENKPLETREKEIIRGKARIIVTIETVIGIMCFLVNKKMSYAICQAVILCAVGYAGWLIKRKLAHTGRRQHERK